MAQSPLSCKPSYAMKATCIPVSVLMKQKEFVVILFRDLPPKNEIVTFFLGTKFVVLRGELDLALDISECSIEYTCPSYSSWFQVQTNYASKLLGLSISLWLIILFQAWSREAIFQTFGEPFLMLGGGKKQHWLCVQ